MPITLEQVIKDTEQALLQGDVFFGHGTDNAWDEAVYLTLGACGLSLDSSTDVLTTEVNETQQAVIQQWLVQRIDNRMPLAYLLGYTWFAGVQFAVAEEVIIPRSPMAELILTQFSPVLQCQPQRALDLCCGSGCIGIAMALQMDIAQVDMVDISAPAIALAEQNIAAYELQQRVKVYDASLYEGLPTDSRYDLIVSNPPYVDVNDFASMPQEFGHEPEMALVSGVDGLDLTATILAEAANWLSDDGLLVVEVGNSEVALQEQLPMVPFLWLDLSNGGNGIFALTAAQCRQWQEVFMVWQQDRLGA
ncbi:MAG: 50S ribosomal protein L3 N(5)-glutamine methyltransferase [Gammaproteobacteria bacterium]|mgnify:CR=1 FL=1|jgi:ribosomal protein L3 glutamine methyltransferase|nr:50S ribosomal protein L3 N(5)-glutamine methyltransferase [Gammaproteobacteria bacterium]